MFCDNCGKPVAEGAKYCDNCGANVGSLGSSIKKSLLSFLPKVKKFLTWRIILSGIAIFLLCLIGYKFLTDYEQSQKLLLSQQQALSSAQQEIKNLAANASSSATIAQEEAAQASSSEGIAEQAQNEAAKADSEAARATGNIIDLSAIVKEWSPSIPIVVCDYTDGSADQGSGALVRFTDGGVDVVTNKHVVTETDDSGDIIAGASSCTVDFPNDPNNLTFDGGDIFNTNSGVDMAYMTVTNPDVYVKNTQISNSRFCQKKPSIGDSVVILGYPANGASQSITATEGIISGYDGDYYVTSAKIDHGNSGGAAIDEKNDCYLGIPTYTETDIESLARILEWQSWY
jgi:cell division protein FtsB